MRHTAKHYQVYLPPLNTRRYEVVLESSQTVLAMTVPFNNCPQDTEDHYSHPVEPSCNLELYSLHVFSLYMQFLWQCFRSHCDHYKICLTNLSNPPASKFVWSLENLLRPSKCFFWLLKTFFRSNTGFWMALMFHGHSTEDDKHSGSPKHQQNIEKKDELIYEDGRQTIHQFSYIVEISYGICQDILTENPNMHWVSVKSVLRLLTLDQKQWYLDLCLEACEMSHTLCTPLPAPLWLNIVH